jgi:arabinoxylan arabinofuranohydrolase
MFRKKVLLSTVIVMAFMGGRECAEAQTKAGKPKKEKENLTEKFANVSPKLTSDNANPLLDFMFTADPTAIEYNGRIYVYATNDHQQYEHVGKDGKNSYEHIHTLVMMSTDDMVNWTYHGLIDTAKLAPWRHLPLHPDWRPMVKHTSTCITLIVVLVQRSLLLLLQLVRGLTH